MRTILLHVNVELPDTDTHTPDQLADALTKAVERGDLFHDFDKADLEVALAEEV